MTASRAASSTTPCTAAVSWPDATPMRNPAAAAADATVTASANPTVREAISAIREVPVASAASTTPRSSSPRAKPVADASAHTANKIASG